MSSSTLPNMSVGMDINRADSLDKPELVPYGLVLTA